MEPGLPVFRAHARASSASLYDTSLAFNDTTGRAVSALRGWRTSCAALRDSANANYTLQPRRIRLLFPSGVLSAVRGRNLGGVSFVKKDVKFRPRPPPRRSDGAPEYRYETSFPFYKRRGRHLIFSRSPVAPRPIGKIEERHKTERETCPFIR